jgi:hypothetical protein
MRHRVCSNAIDPKGCRSAKANAPSRNASARLSYEFSTVM